MKEPIATITNIFYIILGIIIFPNPLFIPFIGLGLTSGWYHWTKTRRAQSWDVRFMYVTFNSIIAFLLYVLSGSVLEPVLFAIILSTWMGYFLKHYSSTYVSAWQVMLSTTLVSILGGHLWFIGTFAIAYLFNIPFLNDYHKTRNWNFLTVDILHGFWHLFTAISYYLIIYQFI